MKIGVSMPPALICGQGFSAAQEKLLNASGGAEGWLMRVREAGADYIELRSVKQQTGEKEVTGAVQMAKKHGFMLTVHGALADESAEAFWSRLEPAMEAQEELTITVHSVADRETTLCLLRRMAEYGLIHHGKARLALENNRTVQGDNADLVECGGVLKTLHALEMPNVGVCWDFGHLYWDHLAHPDLVPEVMPPEEYFTRAIHTHIHSVACNRTHFPLNTGELPLERYVKALKEAGYQGVYNFEPEVERWTEDTDVPGAFLESIRMLKNVAEG